MEQGRVVCDGGRPVAAELSGTMFDGETYTAFTVRVEPAARSINGQMMQQPAIKR